jgi:hypothetical protein
MTSPRILAWFTAFKQATLPTFERQLGPQADLHTLGDQKASLPPFVRQDPLAMRYLGLLGPLAWDHFPERDLHVQCGLAPVPYAPFAAACLVKLDQGLVSMGDLHRFLVEHPSLLWLLGFPLRPDPASPYGFNPLASLPTRRHLTRMLRIIPNCVLQFLLDSSIEQIQAHLPPLNEPFGQAISLDTKHILAWVKENNPKAYIQGQRFDKARQPAGDPDCRLGCKRKHNGGRRAQDALDSLPPTPHANPLPASAAEVGEYYWGYASGVVATKVPGWGEFVLAELTQPFDRPDVSYFEPLMADTERRLGHPPRYGALDAAYDAFYVYERFHAAGGFAAVPLAARGGYAQRRFSPDGLPLCQAGLAMPLKQTFLCRTTLVVHERGRYACPLLYPQRTGQPCPIGHKHWAKRGCVTTLATSIGARLRYQIDRNSEAYQSVYRQRTATERVNSQAVALGIERPHIRNGCAIANINTLIYVLINLRALQRVCQRSATGQHPALAA